jgi:formate dehydrogenase iron-sulfur subunit
MTTVWIPQDAAARSVGADLVARAIADQAAARGLSLDLRRNGSRGMLFLEPLVEVQTPAGRVGYGPVQVQDVPGLFEAGFLQGGAHPKNIGLVDEHPWMKGQDRLVNARVGLIEPLSYEQWTKNGGGAGLAAARSLRPEHIVQAVTDSGLRGRGGAGFPTGIKWKTVLDTPADQKYIVCNADEGDSGTFSDRMLMEGDPFMLIEGMAIAGLAVGADCGYIYLRSEYPDASAP